MQKIVLNIASYCLSKGSLSLRLGFGVLLFTLGVQAFAQNDWSSSFKALHDYQVADEVKDSVSKALATSVERILKSQSDYQFDNTLPMHYLTSNDGKLSIVTWHYTWQDATSLYGGVLRYNGDVFVLEYSNAELNAYDKYTARKWSGGVYYEMVPLKIDGDEAYTLLAWDGNNGVTYKKIIEVLTFNRRGLPEFGKDIFDDSDRTRRIVMEYSSEISLLLEYDSETNRIITNALQSNDVRFDGVAEYYSTSDAFDIFNFENGLWVLYKNVDLRMNKKESKRHQKTAGKSSSGL